MRKGWQKGSYTVEAAVLVPLVILIVMWTLQTGIRFFRESATRKVYAELENLDIVEEFYNYQIIGEIGEGLLDD